VKELVYQRLVGPQDRWGPIAAITFSILVDLGLKEGHKFLDIGCGSLRVGRVLIPFLRSGNYYGTEIRKQVLDAGIEGEFGKEILAIKEPHFSYNNDFDLTVFNQKFDYLLAQSVFSHTPKSQFRECLQSAEKVMKPGATFLASFSVGTEDYAKDVWTDYAIPYRLSTVCSLIEESGLMIDTFNVYPHPQLQWIVIKKGK